MEADHHFLLPRQESLNFKAGDYVLDVYVELVGKKPKRIWTQGLSVSKKEAEALRSVRYGLYFDWRPEVQEYGTYLKDGIEEMYIK